MAVILTSCSKFGKIVKSHDLELKYNAAKEYYAKKDYLKAGQLFDELLVAFKGDVRFQEVYFLYAYTKYGTGELVLASYHFNNFYESFPTHEKAEEALFMHAKCEYMDSYPYYLDPSVSRKAMESIQLFINVYPNSIHVAECNQFLDELRGKLRRKSLESARLYMKMEDYRAAVIAFQNTLKDYPELENRDEVTYLVVKCSYLLSVRSVEDKREERLKSTLKEFATFTKEFGTSNKYYKNAREYADRAQNDLTNISTYHGKALLDQKNYAEAVIILKKEFNRPQTENKDQVLYYIILALYKNGKTNSNKDLLTQALNEVQTFEYQFGENSKWSLSVKKLKKKIQKSLK